MPLDFHPAVANWFDRTFDAPTPAQREAWPAIIAQRHVLIAAPTGSGKTLAAFLAVIDELVREGAASGLADETRVVYVSPLKALSNDIQRNLESPLTGIRDELASLGLPALDLRTFVRTGDTPQHERAAMRKHPPHIVVTTPESLYILMGSDSGRQMLESTRTVIVDEIHAMVASKRGAHLACTLERLEALAGRRLRRIGLSATQKPIEEVARFLVGTGNLRDDGSADCTIVDSGHVRERDLQLEIPAAPLEAVMSGEVWTQVYDRLAELVSEHRTTLVFVNTRRQAERLARHLSERLPAGQVTAHHGSMAKESRLDAEARLKRGELRALVATASLELGIDIGEVDLVCQLASPRSIAAFLQRVGRSGHSVGGTPKGRLFPLSRDDLVECTALLLAVRRGELDLLRLPARPLDVLAQQIVAEVAAREWETGALYALLRRAYPYRELTRAEFDEVVRMLAEGFSTRRGRHGALIHHDAVNGRLKGRRGARLTAITSGGTIPDTADYQVILEPQAQFVGTVNEDFAVESLQGDIFQLGNVSYRILRVEQGRIRVEDAHGEPPSIPFWLGEAPGRSDELSASVSRLRSELEAHLEQGIEATTAWVVAEARIAAPAAVQLVNYLAAARGTLGALPTQQTVVFERFFDEAGGMQLVIHSPFGSRINRAWGLALRKRFCRSFNFELQAAATEDTIVLSLTTAHSFELAEVARYLHSNSVRPLLVQALCAAPMFPVRFRWSAAIALALPRFRGGKKVPAPLARMAAEDLLAAVFPDQVACAENLPGELEIPDHPLVRQAIRDCLEDAMDADGLERLLRTLESGSIRVIARDLTEPSPLALEVLSARPYAYLDDAPLEERRTQAVMSRRWLDPQSAADIGQLDSDAIRRVREEAWPDASNADELHDALLWLTCLTEAEAAAGPDWPELFTALAAQRRVTLLDARAVRLWVSAERLPLFQALYPDARCEPAVVTPAAQRQEWNAEQALIEVVRGRLEGSGPTTAAAIAASLGLKVARIDAALAALQAEGFAMRGAFTPPGDNPNEWCERRLLARIHRYTVKRLRAEIEPIETRDFLRFLFEWQRVTPTGRMEGPDAVGAILAQLEGFEAPASAWETEILPSRISEYEPAWLDEQCLAGRFLWTRLSSRRSDPERGAAPVRATPIVLLARRNLRLWSTLTAAADAVHLSANAQRVAGYLAAHGASFFDEITAGSALLPAQAEEALAELVALGLVNSDSFAGLRALLVPPDRRRPAMGGRRRRRIALFGMDAAGRWSRIARPAAAVATGAGEPSASARALADETVEHVVRTLLRRWGVLFWRLLAREAAWLPPWRDLLMCCRRLEARGEIRGGRFVAGFSGEQYAAPEAITLLREARRRPQEGHYVSLSGADPLNLAGILTPGARLPSLSGNRLLYRDGVPVATFSGGEVSFLIELPPQQQWQARNLLLRRHVPAVLADLA
ncbi:MAG TPA: DEAD/DEAH box helicase [Steroidobacteraceae bacterium]|jgi:ATP-dependent Lhr-like helicase|nr:DEAD/DEAH box helicase [Steroidobacteraceae bacterium]